MGVGTYTLQPNDLTSIGQGPIRLTASQTVSGLEGLAETTLTVDTQPPSFTITTDSNLDINAAVKGGRCAIRRQGGRRALRVLLEMGGTVRALTVSDAGTWSYTLSSADYKGNRRRARDSIRYSDGCLRQCVSKPNDITQCRYDRADHRGIRACPRQSNRFQYSQQRNYSRFIAALTFCRS